MRCAKRRTGLERRPRHRALRRQIDDELSARARRYYNSRRPGRSKSHAAARAIVRRESVQGPLVLKPLFGSQGRGLRLIRAADDLPAAGRGGRASIICSVSWGPSATGFRDFRLLVSRGRVIAAMARHAAALDHQRQARRPAGAGGSRSRTMNEPGSLRDSSGGGAICRR